MGDVQRPDFVAPRVPAQGGPGRLTGAVGCSDVPSLFAARRPAPSSREEADSSDSPAACGRVDVERSRGVWVLTLRGDHDVATQPSLREQLALVTDAGGPIVVDLSRATFIDSTVIAALALAANVDKQTSSPLSLVAPTNYVGTRMVDLVGVGSTIPVYRTRTAAVGAHMRGRTGEFDPEFAAGVSEPTHG